MSTCLIKSVGPTIEKILELLNEVKELDLSRLDRNLLREEIKQRMRSSGGSSGQKRFELHVGRLEAVNQS